jgi:hypothetical protein
VRFDVPATGSGTDAQTEDRPPQPPESTFPITFLCPHLPAALKVKS